MHIYDYMSSSEKTDTIFRAVCENTALKIQTCLREADEIHNLNLKQIELESLKNNYNDFDLESMYTHEQTRYESDLKRINDVKEALQHSLTKDAIFKKFKIMNDKPRVFESIFESARQNDKRDSISLLESCDDDFDEDLYADEMDKLNRLILNL